MRATVRDLPIFLLVVALMLLDAAAFVTIVNEVPRHVSKANGAPIYALAISQASLLGLWAGLGRTRATIRLPVILAIVGALIHFIWYLTPLYPIEWYFRTSVELSFAATAGLIAFAFGVARLAGLIQLIRIVGSTKPQDIAAPQSQFRFTLLEMLQAITSCGVAMAIVKFLYQPLDRLPDDAQIFVSVTVAMHLIPIPIATWAVLKSDFRFWRLGVLAATTIAVSWWVFNSDNHAAFDYAEEARIWPYLSVVAVALFVCRVCGYRIVGKHRDRVALASTVGQCERESTLE